MEVAAKGKAKRRHLNAADCDQLGRSSEGSDGLTQPHTVNHGRGKRDPNWGLYPRTPPKRWRSAAASGSPSGKQRGINDFFSVTGIISSSPNKTSQPCSSAQTSEPSRNTSVKRQLNPVEEEEDNDDDDDDVSLLAAVYRDDEVDDVSLLAAADRDDEVDDVSLLAAADQDDEVDDVSLLAAEMVPESTTKQEKVVDYLEGMTAEMFGADDVFDSHNEDDDVEALPDAHYGLLGSSKELLQPDGCIDDLPEEILREILCQIPARDLYCNVSLVCQRWRSIVQDPKFVPFKKQYYRYMMLEKTTVEEINHILSTSLISRPSPSQHSIRHLVVLMAQHVVRERVRPEDVLQRVSKHRLFPQAEASIRLRIPDIQKNFNLGLQGPNPYAAMALILILCESVDDVQALVSLLTGCMSETAIKEYLSHMAMMLLAVKRSSIQISNRLHYNIYYVLHLMENGPFSVNSGQSGKPQIHLTHEQQQILSHDIQQDHVVKIVAFAGTGKTTTLVEYAKQRPHLHFLYVAFNKSVASEAQRRFPSNVTCKTVHSLAFREIGKSYQNHKKLTFSLKPFCLNKVLPEGRGGYSKAKVVATTLNTFMASADREITSCHVPCYRVKKKGDREMIDPQEIPLFVRDARMIWSKMKDLKEKQKDAYLMTHDGYLKLWQLQIPKPQLSDQFDAIFIDEAQDCTPAIMDVMLTQRCSKILVGDPHQQIYTFKGAVNALNQVHHTHIYYLTQSFRFGAEIAYVGATILKVCKGVHKILVGGKQKGGVCDQTADDVNAAVRNGVSLGRGKTAILARCNLTVFSAAVQLTDANPLCRIHFVGGVESIGLNRILDIYQLSEGGTIEGNPRYIKDPLFRAFTKNERPFWALKMYIDQTEDKELTAKVGIVEKYGNRIPELVKRLQNCFEADYNNADFILGTVHKAKGLEFDTVIVSDDFSKVPCSRHNLRHNWDFSFSDIPDDEWNLLYVAVTRAKTTLIITKTIRRILTVAGEYFLKSEMPTSLMKAGEPLPCTISNCPNCIRPGSAFIMSKQQMKCTDGICEGGPLCERCVWTRIGPTAFLMTDDVLSMAAVPLPAVLRAWPVYHMMFPELLEIF